MDLADLPRVSTRQSPPGTGCALRVDRVRHQPDGPTPETNAAIDKLMVLRAWTARQRVN
jgi:hypothetical protein